MTDITGDASAYDLLERYVVDLAILNAAAFDAAEEVLGDGYQWLVPGMGEVWAVVAQRRHWAQPVDYATVLNDLWARGHAAGPRDVVALYGLPAGSTLVARIPGGSPSGRAAWAATVLTDAAENRALRLVLATALHDLDRRPATEVVDRLLTALRSAA